MRLSQKALDLVKEQNLRQKIALALGLTDRTMWRYIQNNDDNLTKAASLKLIRQETGLSDDEILEEGNNEVVGQN